MILIISSDFDESTDKIMKWLIRKGEEVVRTGSFNYLSGITISLIKGELRVSLKLSSGMNFELDEIKSFWYRKSWFRMFENLEFIFPEELESVNSDYREYLLNEEISSLETFIVKRFEDRPHIGNYFAKNGNKLVYFLEASNAGMKIPDFTVTTDKSLVERELKRGIKMVKPIQDLFYSNTEKESIKNYYSIDYSVEELSKFNETIFPSMLQSYIDKKIEIRVFYLHGELYSMAIFSQNDDKTRVDFRNYNDEFPNRMIPFKMPGDMCSKIRVFMNAINLNTGSLDFILTEEEDYIFLEVNPAGQYGMIEQNCFYSLDERISDFLSYEL
ncbi:grasp-with-spasm system ATP-grasp peptide maturase [Brumimicrobium salinarum]|uniref:Grasp-with-spasm system ATP-grasp peptide maturase n=1 Tax=Brumimicrobium salinarum TaxID=2058658 RepID=A0A2I0QYR7_9FLAO|nr:grasp-with-spasm system ATP-grasp peptide maturase [Brumimicrobium salinarum]PKR79473.1 grasp-with-spasm system ATP-grasp peptide maturase [Brumimicrobium salinarum]